MSRLAALLLCASVSCVARVTAAPEGGAGGPPYSQLWLSYAPVSSAFRTALGLSSITCDAGDSTLLQTACAELRRGLCSMLQTNLSSADGGRAGGAAVTVAVEAGGSGAPVWPPSPSLEGFSIVRAASGGISISARAAHGALNGAWRLLRLVQGESPALLAAGVVEASAPASPLRMWQLWDNMDGTIARGIGSSVLYPLANVSAARVADFARLLSSLGINALSLSNVNACHQGNEALLASATLAQLAPIVRALHAFGIHAFLVPCWSSPQYVGGLNSSDPRDARVTAWWRDSIDRIQAAFGGGVFRGFLFKGDTEGEPGPEMYNMTEQQGANYFGELLNRTGCLAIWRAFSHPPGGHNMPLDQALFQFQRFAGWDAQTQPNVVLQIKNGPYDFQVREPVHALFGALPRTSLILELEALPEYVGQNTHVTSLPVQWAEYLSFDLGAPPGAAGPCAATPTTLAGVVSGGPFCNPYSGMAGVSNFGSDGNWTRHILNGANTFGLGRLAWAPTLSPTAVLAEWVSAAMPGSAPPAVGALVTLLEDSWEAYENFTASLGWGFVCATDHYHMNMRLPSNVDYHNASATRVGYARGAPGAYGSMYNAAAAAAFTSLNACPEELLLSFHNVPYTHALRGARYGGLSVLGWINASHAAGARTSAGFVERWRALEGQLRLAAFAVGGDSEADVFAHVTQRLQAAAVDAAMFAHNVTEYFAELIRAGGP
jgi:alpha-glucuronidase